MKEDSLLYFPFRNQRLRALVSLRNITWISLLLLVILATALRLYDLGSVPFSLYYDEIANVYTPYLHLQAEQFSSFRNTLVHLVTGQYFIYEWVGPSAFWIRFPSVVYGVLFVILCWALAKRLYGLPAGIIAGFLACVVPWSFHFSRYGATIMIAYAFWVTLAVYLLVIYLQTGRENFKYFAFLAAGVSFYTHAVSLFFGFLFFPIMLVVGLAFNHASRRKIVVNVVLLCSTLLLAGSPHIISGLLPNPPGTVEDVVIESTTFKVVHDPLSFAATVMESAYWHLSPDFLAISGGKSFTVPSGLPPCQFTKPSCLYQYGSAGGKVGMLNIYGILVYIAFLWLIYRMIAKGRRGIGCGDALLIWWVVSYAIASGFAYYDNPNAARNIAGLPAFILIISFVINGVWSKLFAPGGYIRRGAARMPHPTNFLRATFIAFWVALFIAILIMPSILYFNTYFKVYKAPFTYFDSQYKLAADYLTESHLWDNYIVIDDTRWDAKTVLSFYNHPASKNISEGNLTHAISLLESEENVVIYITGDTSQQNGLTSLVSARFLHIVYSADKGPTLAIWELKKQRVLTDDDQTQFWKARCAVVPGNCGTPRISDESSIVKSGSDCLEIAATAGVFVWGGIRHEFEPAEDWSGYSVISFWWYGGKSGMPVHLSIVSGEGDFYYPFVDDFEGWRKFSIPISDMPMGGSASIAHVTALEFHFWGADGGTMYLDKVTLIEH